MFEIDGEKLKSFRDGAFLSQRELAERAGITQATLSRLELGLQRVQGRTVRALAKALDVAPDALIVKQKEER